MDDFINSPAAFGALAMIGIGALLFAWGTIKRMILGDIPGDLKALQKEVRDNQTAQTKASTEAFKELTELIKELRKDMTDGFTAMKEGESEKRAKMYEDLRNLRDRVTKLEAK